MGLIDSWTLNRAADLMLTVGLLKASLLTALLWIGIRRIPHWKSSTRAVFWSLGCVALLLLPVLGWMGPVAELQVVQFPQGLFQGGGASAVAPWLALVWLAGSVVLLARFTVVLLRAGRVARRARPVTDPRLRALLAEARRRVGVTRSVRLALAEDGTTPVLIGWRRPVIVLPAATTGWPDGRLVAVLCHELAHVRRGDYLWMILTEVIRAVYWPNPLVFLGLRDARVEQDKACDAAALRAGFRSLDYARHLVDVARSTRGLSPPSAAALSFLPRSRFRERVGALLDRPSGEGEGGGTRRLVLAGAALLFSATSALAATNLWICPGAG